MKNILRLAYSFDYVIKLFFGQKTDAQTENLDSSMTNDTIRIANDTLEYEVIIIDPGFSTWLASRSLPRNYHSQSYLENKILWVGEWNRRVLQPFRYNRNLYEMILTIIKILIMAMRSIT
jgi:hypothetical protein